MPLMPPRYLVKENRYETIEEWLMRERRERGIMSWILSRALL